MEGAVLLWKNEGTEEWRDRGFVEIAEGEGEIELRDGDGEGG